MIKPFCSSLAKLFKVLYTEAILIILRYLGKYTKKASTRLALRFGIESVLEFELFLDLRDDGSSLFGEKESNHDVFRFLSVRNGNNKAV